ncbi:MAG TPA: SIMPL domain-containing protein, partial [Methylobacterium sp.]|nr:SIMPL domain-containing protein [Methylobacterium sp.]
MRRAAVLLVLLGATGAARAQSGPAAAPPAITVEGQASAEVTPDMARLSLGVVADRPTASAAASDVGTAAQAMVAQIKAEGIDDKDVVTTSVTLAPVYPDAAPGNPNAVRAPRGYRASTELLVTVRPAGRAGTVAAHLVDKGANTIEGIAYAA